MEKKLDGNYTRMLRAILNKSLRQHPTKQQLYGHQAPITKTIKIRWTRYVGHCWRSRDELISDVLLWTPTHGPAKAGQPARTYIQQLYVNKGCSPEDLPEVMDDREGWWERVKDICADGATWWWWWCSIFLIIQFPIDTEILCIYIYIHIITHIHTHTHTHIHLYVCIYLPNPLTQAEFNRFEFRVFLLLDWLP